MHAYFAGAIPQLISRAEALELKIRSDLPADYLALAALSRDTLVEIRHRLGTLLTDPRFADPNVQAERLRSFRRCRKMLTQMESRAIATLDRVKAEDRELNAFVRRIVGEIDHPPLPPVVSPLSQMYFSLDTALNILFVPLVENRFLLHLPDVYHELAHQCFVEPISPRLRPVAQALQTSLSAWLEHCFDERQRLKRSRGPRARQTHIELSQRCVPGWVVELHCDLFAVLTTGPAYAWSHLHLSALHGDSPYALPLREATTHPSDEARMRVILDGLRALQFDREAMDVERRWEELKSAGGFVAAPEYPAFYPETVLDEIVGTAFGGFQAAGIRSYRDAPTNSVARVLNQAWTRFWSAPADFVDWEQRAVQSLLRSGDMLNDA